MASVFGKAETSAYVVDHDYRLVYFNKRLEERFPGICEGSTCYRALRGQDAPCEDCPVRLVSDAKVYPYNSVIEKWVETEVGSIEWPGAGSCHILLCREVDDPLPPAACQEPFDELTGLRNRMAFLRAAADLLAAQPLRRYCIMAVDIEHFKLYNELHGEEAGDRFLAETGSILARVQDECATVAGYLFDDDFCIVLPCCDEVIKSVQAQLTAMARRVCGGAGFLPAFGLYDICDPDLPIGTMCDRAALALASVKGNYVERSRWYDESMSRELEDDHALLLGVQHALENGEFVVYAQPKCSMSSGKIVGIEALVRWVHPQHGVIAPGRFIPLLERNGLITQLDTYVWDQVCQAVRRWIDSGHVPLPISVNVSRRDLYAIDVVETFQNLVEAYDLDPSLLPVEITESVFVEDEATISAIVDRLRAAGFTVLMDDFGSGYSSLGVLKDVSVDILKLDMRLLDMAGDRVRKGRGILESIVGMAHLVDLKIIAEGVETKEQRDFLLRAGCLYAQGYYFYRPMPLDELEQVLSNPSNVDYRGMRAASIGRLQVRQLLDESVLSDVMMDEILGPVVSYDVQGDRVELVSVNAQYCELMGVGPVELEERRLSIMQYLYDADKPAFLEAFDRAYREAPSGVGVDTRRTRPDGTTVYVRIRLFFLRERDGHRFYFGSLTDVSEERSRAAQLESSQRALAAVVGVSGHDQSFMSLAEENRRAAAAIFAQMSPGGLIGGYCEDGFPLYFANAEMVRLLGYESYEDLAEGIDRRVANTIHPDDMPSVTKDIGPEYYAGLEYATTYRMRKKNDTWFWVLDKGRVVEAEDGRLAIVSACTDITAVMAAQDRLSERNRLLLSQNKELSFLNEDMPGGYHRCLYSPGFDFLYVSDRFLKLLGYTRQDVKDLFDDKFANMVHPDDRAMVAQGVEALREGRSDQLVELEYRIKAKEGYVWVIDQSRYLEYEGLSFLQGVVVDATKTMELRRAMRAFIDCINDDIVSLWWKDREDVAVNVIRCDSLKARGFSPEQSVELIRERLYAEGSSEGRRLIDGVADAIERDEPIVLFEDMLPFGNEHGKLRIDVRSVGAHPGEHLALCLCSEVGL